MGIVWGHPHRKAHPLHWLSSSQSGQGTFLGYIPGGSPSHTTSEDKEMHTIYEPGSSWEHFPMYCMSASRDSSAAQKTCIKHSPWELSSTESLYQTLSMRAQQHRKTVPNTLHESSDVFCCTPRRGYHKGMHMYLSATLEKRKTWKIFIVNNNIPLSEYSSGCPYSGQRYVPPFVSSQDLVYRSSTKLIHRSSNPLEQKFQTQNYPPF